MKPTTLGGDDDTKVSFKDLTENQCVTWGPNGDLVLPTSIKGELDGGFTYVLTLVREGTPPTPINGDYPFTNSLTVPASQHGSPTACETITLTLVQIDTTTTPPTRTDKCTVDLNLCPTCP